MENKLKVDRRRSARLALPISCHCERLSATSQALLDVGLGGGRLYAERLVTAGEEIEMTLYLPDGSRFSCQARVMWVKVLDQRYELGFKFMDLPRDHLLGLVYLIKRRSLR